MNYIKTRNSLDMTFIFCRKNRSRTLYIFVILSNLLDIIVCLLAKMFKQNNKESRTYAYNKLKKENKQYEAE